MEITKYKCALCGHIHDKQETCPLCGASAEQQIPFTVKQ